MKLLANDGLSEQGIEILQNAGFEIIDEKIPQKELIKYINEHKIDGILVRSATKVTQEMIDSCKSLKIVGRAGVGTDNICVKHALDKGILVVNTPGAPAVSVAEIVFAHALGLARGLQDSNRNMPLEGDTKFSDLKQKYSSGFELRHKTIGIIGFGKIGQAVAKIAIGLGMKVMFYDLIEEDKTIELRFYDGQKMYFTIKPSSLDDLLAASDLVTLHTPALSEPLINKETIKKMKDGAILVNAARGGVIDEKAVLEAIEAGKLHSCALDTFENEPNPSLKVLMNENISLSPHIGASTVDAQKRISIELAENIIKAMK